MKESGPTAMLARKLVAHVNRLLTKAPSYYVSGDHFTELLAVKPRADELKQSISVCLDRLAKHPMGDRLQHLVLKVEESIVHMCLPEEPTAIAAPAEAKECVEQTVYKTMLGVQALVKAMKDFKEDETWLTVMSTIVQNFTRVKCIGLLTSMESIHQILNLSPETGPALFPVLGDAVTMINMYRTSLR